MLPIGNWLAIDADADPVARDGVAAGARSADLDPAAGVAGDHVGLAGRRTADHQVVVRGNMNPGAGVGDREATAGVGADPVAEDPYPVVERVAVDPDSRPRIA